MKLIQRFLLWCLQLTGWKAKEPEPMKLENVYQIPEHIVPVIATARVHIENCKSWDASGEAKRHRVYAQLIKDFPQAEHKDLAFAIELVMQNAG